MKQSTIRQWVNVLAALATLVVNGMANSVKFNGLTTAEISNRFEVFFVPAGYVFSIWGVIYLGLIAFTVYQALPAQAENPRLQRLGYLFALSCVANITWLFLWHYLQFAWTLLAMGALLALLIVAYVRLGIGREQVSAAERWCVQVPFSVYLGWITVATIANVTSVLDYYAWDGLGVSGQLWAVIMMFIGAILAGAMMATRVDAPYLVVIMWAFAGIAVKHAAEPLVANGGWALTAIVGVMLVGGLALKRRNRLPLNVT